MTAIMRLLCTMALLCAVASCQGDTITGPELPVCGDGLCQLTETTQQCPSDCAVLQPPTVVVIGGSVVGLATSIQMQDSSRCTQAGQPIPCATVIWAVSSATSGAFACSRVGEPGETVQCDGLAPGAYSVAQDTIADDGESATKTYNVTVGG